MNKVRKNVAGALVLVAVAGLSYAAGAARGKQPVNLSASEEQWEDYAPGVPLKVAKLWGDRTKGGDYGMLLRMPPNFEAGLHTHTADYHAVSVQGTWVHTNEDGNGKELPPGSYVFQPGKQPHNDLCKGPSECIFLVHQHAKGDFKPAQPAGAKPADKAADKPAAKPAEPK
jgi:hypothetical protein